MLHKLFQFTERKLSTQVSPIKWKLVQNILIRDFCTECPLRIKLQKPAEKCSQTQTAAVKLRLQQSLLLSFLSYGFNKTTTSGHSWLMNADLSNYKQYLTWCIMEVNKLCSSLHEKDRSNCSCWIVFCFTFSADSDITKADNAACGSCIALFSCCSH